MVKLVYSDQAGGEHSVELGAQNPMVMIGRNVECGIQTSNGSVSRLHAMVTWRDGKLFVQDPPNSRPTNGTKVDGMRLNPGEALEMFVGTELLCGNFLVRIVSDNGPDDNVQRMGEQAMAGQPNQANSPYGMPIIQQGRGGYQPQIQPQSPGLQRGAFIPDGRSQPQGPQIIQARQPIQNVQAVPNVQTASHQRNAQPMAPVSQIQPVAPMQPQNSPSEPIRSQKRPNRAGYTPGMMAHQNQTPQPQNIPASEAAADEIRRLQEELTAVRTELANAQSGCISSDDNVKNLQEQLSQKDQDLNDLKRKSEYHESVVTGLKEMIDKLKEQLDHQKEQYQECKKDLVSSQDEADSLKMELSSLKETLESKGMANTNAESAIADLKVQLTQKTRQVSDLQRELDLTQFSCKEERENVERLKENVDTLNRSLEESQRHNRDMKKVVEQHEMVFSELKSNLDDRAREIRQLQDSLRAKGGADATALMNEISKVREMLNKKTSECEMLQKQLKAAEDSAAENQNAASDIQALSAQIDDLNKLLSRKDAEAQSMANALSEQINALKAENDELRSASADSGSQAGSNSVDSILMEKLRALYQEINDVVSQWREDMSTLENAINDLQRVFVAYVKIDINKLSGHDKTRLEAALREYDPKMIFEDIGGCLDSSQHSLQAIKEKLRSLRGALQM